MKCVSKKVILIMTILVLASVSVWAWPLASSSQKSEGTTAVQEQEQSQPVQTDSSTEAETLLNKVSKLQETLLSNSSNSKKVEDLEEALDEVAEGVAIMEEAYTTLKTDYSSIHLGVIPTIGYTFGLSGGLKNSFDVGATFVANYKNLYGSLSINKGFGIDNITEAFKSVDGLRIALGVGFQIF